jgi:glycosyltransferase involved in cell wall biosynthesis
MAKIVYLINDLDTGGAEIFLERLLKGFRGKDFNSTVVCVLPLGTVGQRMADSGIKVICLSKTRKTGILGAAFALSGVLKKEKPDVLNCSLFHSIILGRVVGRICGVKKIISVFHSDNLGGLFRRMFLRFTGGFSDCDVAVSQKIAQSLARKKIAKLQKIKIINLGVDIAGEKNNRNRGEIRSSFNVSDNDIVITALGRLHEAKGYFVLIDAAKILVSKYPNLKFWIMGEGRLRREIEARINERGLAGKLELLGFKIDPSDRLNASDIYALPSLWEGFPNSLIEAMACGLPPVASKVSGAVEIIKDGQNGFLSEVGDPADLAGKLEKLILMGRNEREKVGSAAKRTVEENYSVGRMVREYEKLYN